MILRIIGCKYLLFSYFIKKTEVTQIVFFLNTGKDLSLKNECALYMFPFPPLKKPPVNY